MRLADYVMHRIADEGVRDVFGVYGSAVADLYDVLARGDEPRLRLVATIHEQAAGFAAEGYAKIHTSGLGVAMATSGPGAANLVTAIANCWFDSVPVVFLTGNPPTGFLRQEYSGARQKGFQELSIVDVVNRITKYATRIPAVDTRAIEAVEYAISRATTGRKGPTLLDIPADVQKGALTDLMLAYRGQAPRAMSRSDQFNGIEALRDQLMGAERPVVIVGGGCRGLGAQLEWFAAQFSLPLFPTWNAVDVVTSDQAHYGGRIGTYGGPGRNFAVANCDLLLCLGTRVSGRITGGAPKTFARGAKKWLVNLEDPEETGSDASFDHALRCDVGRFLEAVLGRAGVERDSRRGWMRQVRDWRDRHDPVEENRNKPVPGGGINPYVFADELSKAAPADAVIVVDCGGNAAVMYQAFKTKRGQRMISNHGGSPMGGALCYGIGAAIAAPDRLVIAVIGDGGMQVNVQELQTLHVYRGRLSNLKVFVLNNHCHGITRAYQQTNFGGRYIACGPDRESGYSAPDFCSIADAYGVSTNRMAPSVGDGGGLAARIRFHLFEEASPLVVDVDCGGWSTYEPRVSGWGRSVEEATPALSREEFLSSMTHVPPAEGWEERLGYGEIEGNQ